MIPTDKVSRQIRLITYQRRLVTGHTNENRNDANRIDQREQADKKFKINSEIKQR